MKQVLAFLLLHLLHVGIVQAQASHLERILAARRHMLNSIAVRD